MQSWSAWRVLMGGLRLLSARVAPLLLVVLTCSGGLSAYSVLTHEEIVHLQWTDKIQPLLLARYPGLSEDQIREAHAYAYGCAVIQDLVRSCERSLASQSGTPTPLGNTAVRV